jgi:hypothetical protein
MLKIKILASILILCFCASYSQSYDSVKKNTLNRLTLQNRILSDSLIKKMDQSKNSWLTFLPSVNYDIKNQSVNVGISLNSYTSFVQNKRRNKIELEKLRHQLEAKIETQEENTLLKIEECETLLQTLKERTEIFKISCDLFSITIGKYENKEISIEDFLIKKKKFIEQKVKIKTEIKNLIRKNEELKRRNKIHFLEKYILETETQIINLISRYSAKEINLGFLGQSPKDLN